MNENTQDKYVGHMLDDRYEILDIIGEGGMAVVYKAMCNRLNRYVAVKIMRDEMAADEEFKRRFCAESQAVAMLSHPNIVSVYDVSQTDDVEYIVMELIDGITLKQYLDKKGAVGWRETLHFSKQIAKALSHAHERGIIHRDIKPQNIMLLRDGTIKVADFGIAALENELADSDNQAIGSIHYMAPEQARGDIPDARGDIYSLGVVMYEMLTGKLPYTGETLSEIALKHVEANPVMPHDIVSDFPPELESIIIKAMNPDVHMRYQSADELLSALELFTSSQLEAEEKQKSEISDVAPVISFSEMSKVEAKKQRDRSGKVGFFSGTFFILLLSIFLFAFLWKFWLADIFSSTAYAKIPDFSGENAETVVTNTDYSAIYNFSISYVASDTAQPGSIVSQYPIPGKNMAITSQGIDVTLYVYSGNVSTVIPDVTDSDYREAKSLLESLGFTVEIDNQLSYTVAADKVISSSPLPGESAAIGSTVFLNVSSGDTIATVQVPLLIGLTEEAAIAKLSSSNLSIGDILYEQNDVESGIVIAQGVEAFTEVEIHSRIPVVVSRGME